MTFLIFYYISSSSQLLAYDVQSAILSDCQTNMFPLEPGPPQYSQWTKLIKLITRRTETDLSVMMYVIPTRNLCHWEPASGNLLSCYSNPAMKTLKVSLSARNDRFHTCMHGLNEMFVLLHAYSSMFVIYFRPTHVDDDKRWRTWKDN